MSDGLPKFGHLQDAARYKANIEAGNPLCERCDGCGNELYAMYRRCSACGGSGVAPTAAKNQERTS